MRADGGGGARGVGGGADVAATAGRGPRCRQQVREARAVVSSGRGRRRREENGGGEQQGDDRRGGGVATRRGRWRRRKLPVVMVLTWSRVVSDLQQHCIRDRDDITTGQTQLAWSRVVADGIDSLSFLGRRRPPRGSTGSHFPGNPLPMISLLMPSFVFMRGFFFSSFTVSRGDKLSLPGL
ncbi:hypothetical protein Tsubulata_034516 [Turnera subulata]|uniref:Uncharacterized protein n=1 Tax=Turnera subulata TaxID=218843 RepID=A0A9Q0JEQ0_9ROSI|nr:hypothetical protein Tsubulata_034516 [Turnera subulata]